MTYVKTSQKEVAQTIKWHPRKKINCLIDFIFKWHAFFRSCHFFMNSIWLSIIFKGLFFILKESHDNIKEMRFSL